MRMETIFLAQVLAVMAATGALAPVPPASQPLDEPLQAAWLRQQIEEDWLRQAEAAQFRKLGPVNAQSDARGACDGVKDGKYGFHTALERDPWWQVDLGENRRISRITVFNRLDYAPGLHNADHVRLFGSVDAQAWTLLYENPGAHFGGVSGAKPLQADFAGREVEARFIRLQIPSEAPIYFHLDEVEVYGPSEANLEAGNLALHCPAEQSSISQWSTAKRLGGDAARKEYPITECIASGRRLAAELQDRGLNCEPLLRELDQLDLRGSALSKDGREDEQRGVYLAARWVVRRLVFGDPRLNVERLLFVKRFTQESYPDVCLNHMPWVSRPGGDLCILSAPPGQNLFGTLAQPSWNNAEAPVVLRVLLNRALGPGHVHGMDLSWEGDRVVFGFARARSDEPPKGWLDRSQSYQLRRSEEPIHVFEIGVYGQGLRQLTFGEWSDLDPTYAPNGDIVFVSERCGTSLQCNEYDKDETSCNLYVMKPDGQGIRRMSVSKDGDYLPHTLDDGTIAYTRWEYHERSWAYIQSIWTIRPDGTGADAIFKQHFVDPWALEDTRSIPGSKQLVSIAAGHHTLAVGPLVIVQPSAGVNEPAGIRMVTPDVKPPEGGMAGVPVREGGVRDHGGFYATPWALSEQQFLVSYNYSDQQTNATGYALYLVDVFGNKELVFRDSGISCFSPMPLRARVRPPILPELAESARGEAVCLLTEASFGSEGIDRGQARYVRIAEPIGWPYDNQQGGQRFGEDHRYSGPGAESKNLLSWTPIRILGDVPVELDGSAHFKVPADTAVYFQLLDKDRMELRRMRSFISFQPGEVRACVGCHESRGISPPADGMSLAAARAPSAPALPPWGDRAISFLRDVQPVLDRSCVSCHSGLKSAGGLDFFAGLTSHDKDVAGYGYNRAYETIIENGLISISKVRAQDASITPPLAYGSHRSKLIQALARKPHDHEVRLSEEERLRLVMWIDANGPYHDGFVNKRGPEVYDLANDESLRKKLAGLHESRCANCHKPDEISRLDWIDFRQPQRSLFLAAPLAKQWGGMQRCPGGVYASPSDPDYIEIHQIISAAVARAWAAPRRDLRALLDREHHISRKSP